MTNKTLFQMAAILSRVVVLLSVIALPVLDAGAASQCAENGGYEGCNQYVPKKPWSGSLCDDNASYTDRNVAWCMAHGGVWTGDTQAPCQGANFTIDTPTSAAATAGSYVGLLHPNNSNMCPPPPRTTCSNNYCVCQDIHTGGVITRQYALLAYQGSVQDNFGNCQPWGELLVHFQSREAGCGDGDHSRNNGTGIECVKMGPGGGSGGGGGSGSGNPCDNCGNVGNPINVGNGTKQQREVDYRSGADWGLEIVRYYNSGGFFDTVQREPVGEDYWRHSYSAKVLVYPTNAYVLAASTRPDGGIRIFNLSGVEIQNHDGAAYRLFKVPASGTQTGWKIVTSESNVETYDMGGRLTSITTRAGFITTLSYNTQSQLTTVTDAVGRSLTYAYDSAGKLTSVTDPASRVYQYSYDSQGRLKTVTYPDTKVRTYLYEDPDRMWGLTGIIDERNVRYATYGYDSLGRANSTEHAGTDKKYTLTWGLISDTEIWSNATDAFGTTYLYRFTRTKGAVKLTSVTSPAGTENRTYDANGNLATVTDRKSTVTSYTFDATRNLETSRTEAQGTPNARTITTTWHPTFRLPATITEPSGVSGVNLVTEFTYDTAGNLTKKKLTAGSKVREWNYTVNSRGQVLTVDGPRTDVTDVTTMTYYSDTDSCVGCRGQVNTVTNAAGHVTTYNSYTLDGRVSQITDPNGLVTTLTYKPRGWLESRTTGGETTTYDYDAVGNVSKVTLPDSSWLQYSYDAAGALISVEDSLGNGIEYELDVMGNRVQENYSDPQLTLRRTLQRVYDAQNRLKQEVGGMNQVTTYNYDANSNVSSVLDPMSRTTANTYDFLNRLTNVNDAASGNTVFTYDAKDRLATVKDPKITATTTYTYDGLGNLLTQASPDTGTTTFTYDNAGNVATQTDARGTVTTYSYDVLNRVTAATVTDGTVTYEYDNLTTGGSYAKGRLTKVTDPSGSTTYAYDALGRITSKVQSTTATPSNKTFTVGYAFSGGRQNGVTYPSGRAITYGFNAQGQVTSIAVDGTTLLSGVLYQPFGPVRQWTWANAQVMERRFDLDGRLTTLTTGPSTGTYSDLLQGFGYDALNRLTSANLAAGQTQGFTYDANSNRLTSTVNAASTTYTYPTTSHKLSSLSGATTRSFTYDNAGNVTASAGITYVYDGRGRMKQAGTTNYLINGLGQRVKKASGTTDTYFAYDEAGRLIGEYDTAGAAIQETVWLGDLPVAVLKPATPSGFTEYYIWADHLGTPRHITDAANQSRWEWPNNDPFGNNAPNENPATLGVFAYNLRLPGQYYDSETGLHHNYFRDYDAATGRYVQSDPIGVTFGSVRRSKGRARMHYQLNNLYGYAFGNPVRYIDPLGLAPNQMCVAACSLGGGLIGGAFGQAAGGAIGGLLGGAGGTAVAPGVGTVGGAAAGALAGGRLGGALGAAGGTALGNALGQAICSEDKEEECHEAYVLQTKNCDAYKNIFGDRWWRQCYKEAFGDYQRCRGYSSPD